MRPPAFQDRPADWLAPGEAQRRILEACVPLPAEEVPVEEALGRALAENLHAAAALPPWDNAAMDGYAVRSADLRGASAQAPRALRVLGAVRAGGAPPAYVQRGEAVRIMTGAPLPPGADSVVRVEDTDREAEPGTVRIVSDRDAGRNVRPGGEDFRSGDRVLGEGQAVHPGVVAVLAALGRRTVAVGRRPTVTVLTTGDELRPPERYEDVAAGRGIPESNGPMIAAQVVQAGGVPRVVGPVPDGADALRRALRDTAGSDVVVTVGGASVGEADLVKGALEAEGYVQDFWRVDMRPGSPFSFGWLPSPTGGRRAVFGLPGNPSSAFVTFEVLVRPFLLRMAGHALVHRRRVSALAGEALRGGGRTLILRVGLTGEGGHLVARPTGPRGSGLVAGLASAQGLALLPPAADIAPGDPVEVLLLDPGPAASHVPSLGPLGP